MSVPLFFKFTMRTINLNLFFFFKLCKYTYVYRAPFQPYGLKPVRRTAALDDKSHLSSPFIQHFILYTLSKQVFQLWKEVGGNPHRHMGYMQTPHRSFFAERWDCWRLHHHAAWCKPDLGKHKMCTKCLGVTAIKKKKKNLVSHFKRLKMCHVWDKQGIKNMN